MARYLVRLSNRQEYSPSDIQIVADKIRKVLGSRESASHFRIGTKALEFNVFASNEAESQHKRGLLEKSGFKVLTAKLLDTTPSSVEKEDALAEGLNLFNEERFWEAHEILEQVWREEKGPERDAIQSIILTCAAFVHYQKGEKDICLSVLRRARAKMRSDIEIPVVNMEVLQSKVEGILQSGQVRLFKLKVN